MYRKGCDAMFTSLHTMTEVKQFIAQNRLAFLYVTQPNCSVCHGLLPQLEPLLEQFEKIATAQMDATEVQEAAGQFSLYTAPVALLFIDGKEYIRKARFIPLQELQYDIERIYHHL